MKLKISTGIIFLIILGHALLAQPKMRGINLVSPVQAPAQSGIQSLSETHTNWVALCPWAFMLPDDPSVYYNTSDNYWGDRPENMKQMIEDARSHHLKILLKPHFWVKGQGWPGDLQMNKKSWAVWEKNYRDFVLEMGRFAEENHVDMYCIGVEFKTATRHRTDFWKGLIQEVRKIYSGKLLYAANWDNYNNIGFWDRLDYIGIDAYFPLLSSASPTKEQLKKSWERQAGQLDNFSGKLGKQIIFTEYGYRSTDYAAWRQWEIEQVSPVHHVNLSAQENAYAALYESIWNKSWLAGGFIWKWYPDLTDAGGSKHSGYTPQNKPVMEIIKKWYAQ